ncbi:MAG: cell division protein ZapA [Chitinophagales bacterium]|nr:cell division protein ZapA [Chitinophagales bacterium]MDW8419963.1 cell division protein ZapA [Chitinophagales bacterium]
MANAPDTINMQITIADRAYPLLVSRCDEQKIKHAVQLVNDTIDQYRLQYNGLDRQDYLAMCLLKLAVKTIEVEQEHAKSTQQISDKLTALGQVLQSASIG